MKSYLNQDVMQPGTTVLPAIAERATPSSKHDMSGMTPENNLPGIVAKRLETDGGQEAANAAMDFELNNYEE